MGQSGRSIAGELAGNSPIPGAILLISKAISLCSHTIVQVCYPPRPRCVTYTCCPCVVGGKCTLVIARLQQCTKQLPLSFTVVAGQVVFLDFSGNLASALLPDSLV